MKTEINFPVGMYQGRLIGNSKTNYCRKHPNDLIMFNAVMVTESDGIIWNGDINAHVDKDLLIKTRNIVGEDLYFLSEHEGYELRDSLPLALIAKSIIGVRKDRITILDEYCIKNYGDFI